METHPTRRVRVIYRGHVQGVGFRATCVTIAGHWTLTGFVRNEPDGSVSLEVQGATVDVEQFLAAVAARMQANITAADLSELARRPTDSRFRVTD